MGIELLSTTTESLCYRSPSWIEVKTRFADLKTLGELPLYSGAVLRVVEHLIKLHEVLIFGKTYCSTTTKLMQFLDEQRIQYTIMSLDKMACLAEPVRMENG